MADPKKPGWKTSEGIFTAIGTVIACIYILGIVSPDGSSPTAKAVAFVAMALAHAGYSVSRGKVKAANASADTSTPSP